MGIICGTGWGLRLLFRSNKLPCHRSISRVSSHGMKALFQTNRRNSILPATILLASCMLPTTQAATLVAIKAEATEEYLKERARNTSKQIQTYQFMKGHHFKGRSSDKSVEEVSFNEIIQDLAQCAYPQS